MASRRNEQPAEKGRLIETDVLVIGGGPSAAWAALSAAEAGARVVLADKGYHGTSGATAPSNTGTWCVPPGEGRAASVEQRFKRTAGLADRRWMLRSADRAYENLQKLVEWGYPFPSEEDGSLYVANLRGPDYMRFMRRHVHKAGVTILDHHPILELLGDDNHIGGAAGLVRRTGASFRVSAGAVVLATGGCAFFERILGGTGLTGDGYLFAVEAGASLSGMEFTGKYTLAPHGSSLNKGLPFRWATFYRENGEVLRDGRGEPVTNGIGGGERQVADAMLSGPVYARLDLAEPAMRDWLRRGQPNCFQPYDRMGIDPFEDLFRVELKYEGTVRGTGGIRLVTSDCATGIAGLYAAGDAASRENVTGGVSGGGAVNASWAIASGWWAGHGAAQHARRRRGRDNARLQALGTTGLRGRGERQDIDLAAAARTVHDEIAPLDKSYWRTAGSLEASRRVLEDLWSKLSRANPATGIERLRSREVASVTASARWTVAAALLRTESRGVHRRRDFPGENESQAGRIIVSGLDRVTAVREDLALEDLALGTAQEG
ncbi:FAD-dependent oxidoreductase [Sinorhizobium meliloti]|jgi:succinate dehydrogenase/fumarate reductase flavoprotein subunit|uniref:Oxidoreductase n=5 Tax=Rhizobium meliloti TaxID=382 RepID=Q92MN7_RHIME|nr:FAD-binding protein [Sinorhizobium meliloti]PST24492.1 oxidoreductase [Mesorhizobium loti]TWA97585.1 succinate dehydrogenase/fumarate reductase flavoprotein subunit [Ensifer sp. SEMIA 134]TWB33231.1 succinate dehydrogenase/fumarate reductase flavoprotein subunit [Ensifer sp. SEMIA 135]AEG05303.1 FAD dependent oxidoreductase [Sinorhizobium meliloti BL225C]AEG54336.1 FAD dependent oxidoreductase [Sinorhizobium meliloti AK83]